MDSDNRCGRKTLRGSFFCSLVRIRMASKTSVTKILPSPILPVLAAFTMASVTFVRSESGATIT